MPRLSKSTPDTAWPPTLIDVGDLGEFVGSGELEDLFDVSRQRVYQLTSRKDFPAPALTLKMGKLWRTADVVKWAEERGRDIHDA